MYQTRFKAITYRASVDGTTIPEVFESGVHPLDVNKDDPMRVFVDFDLARTDGRSTAGYVVFLNGVPVIWSSKPMKVAVKCRSGSDSCNRKCETCLPLRNLLSELGICKSESIYVREDNKVCKESAESLKCHKRARHYQGELRYLQDCHQNGSIKFYQTPTALMIADFITKSFTKEFHQKHMDQILH